ncbi:MAG: hypothetical protein LBB20_01125 [Puniceicoccales bacterium]|nr:hypothetical protein [Puniceicoccales bacterium]
MLFLKTVARDIIPIPETVSLVLAIGIFDGVHLGHERVIQKATEIARSIGGKTVVYTFSPHPTAILGNRKNLILTSEQKFMRLNRLNVDYLVEQHFDKDFASLNPEDFMDTLKHKFKTINTICIGQNFRFGSGRIGDASYLRSISPGFGIKTTVIQSLMANDTIISSTRIRQELVNGNLTMANSMLGYNYYCSCSFEGKIQLNDIQILTFSVQNEQQIGSGVYSVNVLSANKICHGVADYLHRSQPGKLSLHLLGNQPKPSDNVTIEFLSLIRERMTFSTDSERVAQIKKDIEATEKLT